MAKALNKKRLRDSRLAALILLVLYAFSYGLFADETLMHGLLKYSGYFLVIVCAFGRVYCTAYLGGNKNVSLMMEGPFSVTRNPLYMFSFIGFLGVGLMSTRLTIIAVLLGLHVINYNLLVRREEAHLLSVFGEPYREYCARVPRFFPKLSLYRSPETLTLRIKLLVIAMRDALAWFLPYPLFELVEYLHEIEWLPTLFLMP